MGIKVTMSVKRRLGRAKIARAIAVGSARGLTLAGADWRGAMTRRFRAHTGRRSKMIHARTGRLRQSMDYRVTERPGAPASLTVFSAGVPYAAAQEYGAVIRPVRAKKLSIPGPANLTAAGVPRVPSARAWFNMYRATGRIRVVPGKAPGTLLVFLDVPGGVQPGGPKRRTVLGNAQGNLWWILVSKSTIPGPETTGDPSRLGMRSTLGRLRRRRLKFIAAEVVKAIRQEGRGG